MNYRHGCFVLLGLTFLLNTGCADQQTVRISKNIPIPSGNGLDGDEEQAILSYHNELRASVKAPLLEWSIDLSKNAATWAATLATQGCKLQHSKNSPYGENLFMGSSDDKDEAVMDAVESWGSEQQDYSGEPLNKGVWSVAGNYTQMVWRNTTHLGCAKVACDDKLIVVCHYSPVGNVMGEKPY